MAPEQCENCESFLGEPTECRECDRDVCSMCYWDHASSGECYEHAEDMGEER